MNKFIYIILLFLSSTVQAEVCNISFEQPTAEQNHMVWVIARFTEPSHLFWIYYMPREQIEVSCNELGLLHHGDGTFQVIQVTDTQDNSLAGYSRLWGSWVDFNIITGLVPNPPQNLN